MIATNGYSQSDFKKIDEYAKSIDYNENKSLAKELTKNSTTELEKVRAIFIWITDNIEYDFELYQSPELQDELYTSEANVIEHTLKNKKAICSGYSYLFKSLCDEIGIESVYISGFSKQFLDGFEKKPIPDHAWNAVKINNKWYLLDATWASGNGFGNHFEKGFDEYWFLTNPKEFIYNHYPVEQKWTLLSKDFTIEKFYDLPTLTSHWFFTKGIKVINPKNGILKINSDNKFIFEFETENQDIEISLTGSPWETFATLNDLPEPTDEEFKKDPSKYNLIISSIELINKKVDGKKITFQYNVIHRTLRNVTLSIDGFQTAEYKVEWK